MTEHRREISRRKPWDAWPLSCWFSLCFLLSISALAYSCTARTGEAQFQPKIEFGFDFDFLRCETRGVSVRCESERRTRRDVWLDWFDRREGWRSARFQGGVVPRELVCSDHVLWFLFHCEGTEVVWLSAERDVRKWKGCNQPEPYEIFYFPLTAGPRNSWILYEGVTGAEFVALRFVPFYPGDSTPVTDLSVVLLRGDGQDELLGKTDAAGQIVLSKEVLKKKDGRYLLVNPTYYFDRVAVPLEDVLQKTGSYFREVFLVYVGFY